MTPAELTAEIDRFEQRGHFAGRRIVLVDPDEPRQQQIYEDLDLATRTVRHCLVTLYPRTEKDDQIVVDHGKAIRDIRRMLANGWRLSSITRDLFGPWR